MADGVHVHFLWGLITLSLYRSKLGSVFIASKEQFDWCMHLLRAATEARKEKISEDNSVGMYLIQKQRLA